MEVLKDLLLIILALPIIVALILLVCSAIYLIFFIDLENDDTDKISKIILVYKNSAIVLTLFLCAMLLCVI